MWNKTYERKKVDTECEGKEDAVRICDVVVVVVYFLRLLSISFTYKIYKLLSFSSLSRGYTMLQIVMLK